MSRIIDRLYEKGMVSWEENPDDRRQKSVKITEKGLKLLDEIFDCEKESDNLLYCSPESKTLFLALRDRVLFHKNNAWHLAYKLRSWLGSYLGSLRCSFLCLSPLLSKLLRT
ncbi:MAG TPA: hypothetical protein PLQ09_10870 [Prolixibacteraceae bacterium]|nr:hypothetical protein [Prolixibacteraceae bacterium]